MSGIKVKVISYGGHTSINDGVNLTAVLDQTRLMPSGEPDYVPRADNFAFLAQIKLGGHTLALKIALEGVLQDGIDLIRQYFYVGNTTPQPLVIQDLNDGSKEWTVMASPIDAINEDGIATVLLATEDPIWVADSVITAWAIATSPVTKVVSVGGILSTAPIFRFTAQNAKTGGFAYKKWYPIWNPTDYSAVDYAFEITDGGINTNTLISGGKMQSDGDDWRLIVMDVERDCWKAGFPGTNSKMWALFNFIPRIEMTLSGTIASSGPVTSITVKNTVDNVKALSRLASQTHRVLVIGTEAFTFPVGGVSVTDLTITITARQAFLTTIASHADGDVVRWPQYGAWMVYGNSTVGAPSVDDRKKPLIDMAASNNNLLSWSNFKAVTPRAFSWVDALVKSLGKLSDTYTGNHNTDVLPSTELGMTIKGYTLAGVPKAETATLEWTFTHPFHGLTTISATGEKKRDKGAWPAIAGLFKIDDQGKPTQVWNDASPSTTGWEALAAHSGVSLGGNYGAVKFQLNGSLTAVLDNAVYYEINSVTLAINSALRPQTFATPEQDNYYFDIILQNVNNAGRMRVSLSAGIGDVLEIDCEAKEIRLNGELTGVEPIGGWLTADIGSTTFRFTDAGTTDVDGEIEIQPKRIL